jgi:hypothetical protein
MSIQSQLFKNEYRVVIQRQDDKRVVFHKYVRAMSARAARRRMVYKLRNEPNWHNMRVLGVRDFRKNGVDIRNGRFVA